MVNSAVLGDGCSIVTLNKSFKAKISEFAYRSKIRCNLNFYFVSFKNTQNDFAKMLITVGVIMFLSELSMIQ